MRTFANALIILSNAYLLNSLNTNTVNLYEKSDYQGQKCTISVSGCRNVCNYIDEKASSLNGDTPCVQLYRAKDCKEILGSWKSFTQNPMRDFKGQPLQDAISSVGDCNTAWEQDTIWLHEDKDWKGKQCELKVDKNCKKVCDFMERKASSIDGTKNCTNVYSDKDCRTLIGTWRVTDSATSNFKGTKLQDSIMGVKAC